MAATTSSLDDILGQLDATAAAGREAEAIRADRGPRIPKLEHAISYEWRPPPSKKEVLKTVSKDCCRRFNRTTKHSGDAFRKEPILAPTVLGVWHADYVRNCVPSRSFTNPRDASHKPHRSSGVTRYHAQSDPLEEPTDEQLHEQHRSWLEKHRGQREKHLHPVYHALVRVEKAVEKENEIQQQRETATDLMTRGLLQKPALSCNVKAKLAKAHMAVKSTRAFNKLKGIDNVADEQKKNEGVLLRAKSQPILEHKPATPRHRARHLRTWKGTDRRFAWSQIDVCLKHTTPGLAQEEEWALHNSPRYRARGA